MSQHVDVTFHPSWWNRYAGIEFDEKFFYDAQYRMEADIVMRRTLYELFGEYGLGEKDPKARPVLFSDLIACGFLYSQLLGCEVVYAKDNAPAVLPANFTEEQVKTFTLPNLDHHPLWQKVQKQIDLFMEQFGYVESAVNLMGIQNIAMDLRGEELFYDYYDEPELAHRLLEEVTQLSLEIGKRLYQVSKVVSGGVTSIIKQVCPEVYLTSNCSVTMISCDTYCEHLLQYDTRLAGAFPDFGIHHCGNHMENVLEGYLKVPNLKFLEIGAGSDLEKIAGMLKSHNREDIINCIRYSPVKLKTDSEEQMREERRYAKNCFGENHNLCYSCVGIDTQVSHEKVREYLKVYSE